jgi:subfamily B ATP-binding cassette protein MsbA
MALLAATVLLARGSFGAKDDARRDAGRRLVAVHGAVDASLQKLVFEARDKLLAWKQGEPAPPPLVEVEAGVSVLDITDAIPVEDAKLLLSFERRAMHVLVRRSGGAEADFLRGRIPYAELTRRFEGDPGIGRVGRGIPSRLLLVEADGEVVWPRPKEGKEGPRKGLDLSPQRVTQALERIQVDQAAALDDDAIPPTYKDASEKKVLGWWDKATSSSSRLWIVVEAREADVVAGTGSVRVGFFGNELFELAPWHATLAFGLLALVAAALIWLPSRAGQDVSVLLRTYSFAKPYIWGIAAAVLVAAIFGAARAYRAFIAKSLVDDVLVASGPEAQAGIWRIAIATLVLGVVIAVSNYFKEYLQNYYSTTMMADIRLALARKIVGLPLSFFNRIRAGDLVARIERDVSGMRQVLLQLFDKAFAQPFTMVASIVVAFMINWRLALVLLGMPFLVYPLFRIAKRIKTRASKRQNLLADMSHVLFQMLAGIKVVKAFHGEEREAQRLSAVNRRFIHEVRRIARLSAFSSSLLDFLQMVGGAILVVLGGYGVLRGNVQPGDLMAFVLVIASVYDAAKDVTSVANKMIEALPGVQRVFEVFDTPNELVDGEMQAPPGALRQGIELRGVKFRYLENEILKGVDLFIPAGSVVALVGPTGSGKTTLCDLVARFYDPTAGAILWDGVDARSYTVGSLASRLAIVTQDAFLFNAPIDENIRYGKEDATDDEVRAAARAANVHDEIEQMEGGYSKSAGERGASLSGGQRQRVTIARALIKNAPVLILDEATSNLDSAAEQKVQSAIERLVRGRTVIVVAHRLSTIRNADKVVVMEEGRIVEEGSPEALLQRPAGRFRGMWDLQTGERSDAPPELRLDHAGPGQVG